MSKRKQSTLDSSFFHPRPRKAPRLDNKKTISNGNSSRHNMNADHPSTSPQPNSITNNPSPKSHKDILKTAAQPASKACPSSSQSSHNLLITLQPGDLFAAPKQTILIHACNTRGTWGAGIAAAFKFHYPAAFKVYNTHCTSSSSSKSTSTPSGGKKTTPKVLARGPPPNASLIGTTLLIPPQTQSLNKAEREAQHFIACLFTSKNVGRNKDSAEEILTATGDAVRDLLRQVKFLKEGKKDMGGKERVELGEMVMCKINSGLFGVPWERTQAVLEGIEVEGDEDVLITVMEKD